MNNPLGDLDYPAWWKRWIISPEWEQRPERLAEATATDSKLFTGRLLVLRGIDDEAALSLATGAVINRVTKSIYKFSAGILLGSIGAAAYLALIKVVEQFSISYAQAFVRMSMIGLASSALASLFLPSFARMVFGGELALGAMRCDVLFESVPDMDEVDVQTIGIGPRSNRLVHSLYEVQTAPQAIAKWFVQRLRGFRR